MALDDESFGLLQQSVQRFIQERLVPAENILEDEDDVPADIVADMKEGQDAIYYITGESQDAIRNSPHLEGFAAKGIEVIGPRNNNFFDPWGNRIEIVGYRGIQFSKTEAVLNGMGLGGLEKTDAAKRELAEKGLG